MENLESKYVSDYSNKNINRYTYNGEKPSLKHSSTKPEYMNQGKIIIISGPSASGKSAIIDSLVSLNKNYIKATPATSRNKGPGEKPNQDYYFLSEQEFVQKINNDAFFEYSNYLGLYYGTLKAPIYSDIECGKNVILDISLEEAFKLKRKYPEIILVYITPPDAITAIMRLRKREQNDKQHILERLTVYAKESYSMLRGDILLVNNNTEKTAQQLSTIINNISESDEAFEESVESVISFKKEITQYLKSNYADSLNHLSSENSYESTTDTTISMELQIIRSMLEKLIEEKKEKDNSDNLIVDALPIHSTEGLGKAECTESTVLNNRIDIKNYLEMDFPGITFRNFISIFQNYSLFKIDTEKIADILQRSRKTLVDRWIKQGTYGTMRKENYKTLFDLFHTKIKDPEERVNILVREFNMPEQCRNMQYKDIQRIIIQSLDKKCTSVKKRN